MYALLSYHSGKGLKGVEGHHEARFRIRVPLIGEEAVACIFNKLLGPSDPQCECLQPSVSPSHSQVPLASTSPESL